MSQCADGRCSYCGIRDDSTIVGNTYCVRCTVLFAEHSSCWSRRVVRRTLHGREMFGIHEVYFTNEKPTSATAEPMFGYFETLEELVKEIQAYQKTVTKPFIDWNLVVEPKVEEKMDELA